MEHIIASNLVNHFTINNILYDLQHGFREKRSCETPLLMLVDELARNIQHGKQTDLILPDFSKAFDKVSHNKLIYKLHQLGVWGRNLAWIRGFLSDRSQRVVVDGEFSSSIPVTSGIPQGSVLGPILFLAYINDLPEQVKSQVRLFADETVVYITMDKQDSPAVLQGVLKQLELWETLWDMEFNPGKCQVIHVTTSRYPLRTDYVLHGQVLETTTSARYLGVDISDNLNWSDHKNRVTSKGQQLSRLHSAQQTDPTPATSICNIQGCSPSTAGICCQCLGPAHCYPYKPNRTCPAQGCPFDHIRFPEDVECHHYVKYSGWRNLAQRRADSRLVLMYKIVHGLVAIPKPSLSAPPESPEVLTLSASVKYKLPKMFINTLSFPSQ